MSAVLLLVQRGRASMFADAAVYTPDGRLAEIRSKVHVLRAPACAIAVRGHTTPTGGIPPTWAPPATFDGVVDALPDLLRQLLSSVQDTTDRLTWPLAIEVTAIGYSESRRSFEGWGIASVEPDARAGVAELGGYQPFRPMRVPDTWGAPGFDADISQGFVRRWTGVPRERIAPEEFGVQAIQAARLGGRFDDDDGRSVTGAMVGGFIEMAQVGPEGASRKLLARWPDRIGLEVNRYAPLLPALQETDVRSAFLERVA